TLTGLTPQVDAVAVSPDGRTLAAKVWNTVRLFDAATGEVRRTIELANTNGGVMTEGITFTSDGESVALTQGESRAVLLVSLETGAAVRTFPRQHVVYAAAFSPDGTRLVAGGYDSDKGVYFSRLWDVATGKELRRLPHGNNALR